MSARFVDVDEFPHGLCCDRCDLEILVGQEYAGIPFADDIDILVCADCAKRAGSSVKSGEPQ